MIKFIPTKNLTKEDKFQVALMIGKIVLWILNGRSLDYMAKRLKLDEKTVLANISELTWTLSEFWVVNNR